MTKLEAYEVLRHLCARAPKGGGEAFRDGPAFLTPDESDALTFVVGTLGQELDSGAAADAVDALTHTAF